MSAIKIFTHYENMKVAESKNVLVQAIEMTFDGIAEQVSNGLMYQHELEDHLSSLRQACNEVSELAKTTFNRCLKQMAGDKRESNE